MIFLGSTLIVLAAVALVWLQIREPKPIREPLTELNVDKMTFVDWWTIWPRLEMGIQRGLFAREAATLAQERL